MLQPYLPWLNVIVFPPGLSFHIPGVHMLVALTLLGQWKRYAAASTDDKTFDLMRYVTPQVDILNLELQQYLCRCRRDL